MARQWHVRAAVYLAILAVLSLYFQRRYKNLADSYQAALDRYRAERETTGKA